MTLIAWYLDLVVLNNVLFDDGLSRPELTSLCNSLWIEISLRDEAVISWNVRGGLCGSCCKLVIFIHGLGGICGKFISWVMSKGSQGLLILSVEIASLR